MKKPPSIPNSRFTLGPQIGISFPITWVTLPVLDVKADFFLTISSPSRINISLFLFSSWSVKYVVTLIELSRLFQNFKLWSIWSEKSWHVPFVHRVYSPSIDFPLLNFTPLYTRFFLDTIHLYTLFIIYETLAMSLLESDVVYCINLIGSLSFALLNVTDSFVKISSIKYIGFIFRD